MAELTYGVEHIDVIWFGESQKIIIGKFCSIAPSQLFFLGGNHRTDWVTTYPFGHVLTRKFPPGLVNGARGHPSSKGDIVIGNDVWIGYGCSIMSGVHVGDGAVIAACSLVSRNAPPYSVVGGNPARLLRLRFDESMVAELLELKWWVLDAKLINEIIPVLQSQPSLSSIQELRRRICVG